MEDNLNFIQLAYGLTIEERQDLLKKLKAHSKMSGELLYAENDKSAPSIIENETGFSSLPWFLRLWFTIVGLFKAKSPKKTFEDHRVTVLGKRIERQFPKLFNYRSGMLLPEFYKHLLKLQEAAHFFYSALDASTNRNRSAFFAFLGSLEMTDVHRQLVMEIDPAQIAKKNPDADEADWQKLAIKVLEDLLTTITEEQRSAMYFDARSLFCLNELSSFPFDRLLGSFSNNRLAKGEACSAISVKDLLISLNNTLLSLKIVPHMALLQSLFVFMLQQKAKESSFNLENETDLLLSLAEEYLGDIQEFNKQVPLNWIIRCSSRDMSIFPKEISGGEDWFMVYRDYWKQQIEILHNDYLKTHRQEKLAVTLNDFLKGQTLQALENTQSPSNPNGLPIKGALAISFLQTFYLILFVPGMERLLRPIYLDADFKENENRVEFEWGYSYLAKLGDVIQKFQQGILPSGIHGEKYARAQNDRSLAPLRHRNMQTILERVQKDAKKIIEQSREAFGIMANVLSGILGVNSTGKHFTLSNLSKFTDADPQFAADMSETVKQFKTAIRLLSSVEDIEIRR